MPNRKLPSDPHECYDYLLMSFLRRRKAYGPLESRNRLIGILSYAWEHKIPLAPEVQQLLGEFKGYKTIKVEEPTAPVVTITPSTETALPNTVDPAKSGNILAEFED